MNFEINAHDTIKKMNRKIFALDRTCSITEAIIWMAAVSADEIKFETVRDDIKVERVTEGTFSFTGTIPKNICILHRIHFSVPIWNFRMWISAETKTDQILLDLTDQETGITGVTFDKPIEVFCIPYATIKYSYSFYSGSNISPQFDNSTIYGPEHKFLNPLLQCSLLQNSERNELIKKQEKEMRLKVQTEYPDGNTELHSPIVIKL